MLFWIICFVLTCVVAIFVITPMVRPPLDAPDDPQVALYKAQLEEVDRDVAREVLAPEEAAQAKTEIARRLLAASRQGKMASAGPAGRGAAVATVAVIIALAGGIYWQIGTPGYPDLPLKARIAMADEIRANRPSQAEMQDSVPAIPAPDFPAEYIESIAQLRDIVPQRPDDLRGWEMLAYHESQMRDYPAAAAAQARVVEIKGDSATIDDLVSLADLMAAAADGYVSPETETIARRVLAMDPDNIAGRYYLGAMYFQTERPDRALQIWRSILDRGAAETFHLALARRFIGEVAIRAGTDYTPPPATNVDLESVLGDGDMSADAQSEMIEGMVARLSDRLATQGGPVDQWARLIVAYGVLSRFDDARAIMAEAVDVFGASDEALSVLNEAALRAGIAE